MMAEMADTPAPPAGAERTLAIIKPDAEAHEDEIVHIIKQAGFSIVHDQARDFYAEHSGKRFFEPLTDFMCSGPIVVLCLMKPNAIAEWRMLLGPTDSNKARLVAPDSIRALFGTDNQRNACHGSDSVQSSNRELSFYFPEVWPATPPTSAQIRTYLETAIYPIITPGLTQLCKEKPSNPTEWLGNWLLNNNPNKPMVVEPGV
ncbi:hypothetical protein RI367_001270 [Sorochytrium milnesiophthora]